MGKGTYYEYLDIAKGIGIILVIMGHGLFPLHYAIDVFHMPLFFTLSGLTYNSPDNKGFFLLKKIDRIYIPYIFFSIVSVIASYFIFPLPGPFNGPLWFLQTIFSALLLYMLLDNWCRKSKMILHGIIFLFSLYTFWFAKLSITILPFSLDRTLTATVFLHIGHIIKDTDFLGRNKLNTKIGKAYFMSCTLIYAIGLYLLIHYYNAHGNFVSSKAYSFNYILFYCTSISAIMIVLLFSYYIQRIPELNFLGKHSLIIMAVHFPFMERLNFFISTLSLYHSGVTGKLILGLVEYGLTILFCLPFIFFFKTKLPSLTGYKNYFTKNYSHG